MATIADLRQLVSETKPKEAAAMTSELLAAGHDPMDVLEEGVMNPLRGQEGDRPGPRARWRHRQGLHPRDPGGLP
jgi:hypothetical protein